EEARLGPIGIDNGSADGMQIESSNIGLKVENIGEVLGPIEDSARAGGVQVVVVGEESALGIVGDVNVVTSFGPEDVVADFNVAGAVLDVDVVTEGRVEGVADD